MALGDFGVSVSPNTVARLLHQIGYSLHVGHKNLSTDNDQFLYLSDLRQRIQRQGLRIISVDTKKREQERAARYPRSRQPLILSDTGGSNGARRRTWKTELQSQGADSRGLTLTLAHYPTGASKWKPIEHRLFSEISKNWAGEPLDSYQKILNFIRSTRTETGLSVTAQLDSQLSHRYGTDTRTASIPSTQTARDPAEVELHNLTQSVKLFLRHPLAS